MLMLLPDIIFSHLRKIFLLFYALASGSILPHSAFYISHVKGTCVCMPYNYIFYKHKSLHVSPPHTYYVSKFHYSTNCLSLCKSWTWNIRFGFVFTYTVTVWDVLSEYLHWEIFLDTHLGFISGSDQIQIKHRI